MAAPLPDLETLGLSYLRRRSASYPVAAAGDPVHVLNPKEMAALRRIERGAIVRAGIAGALSGAAAAGAEVWAPGDWVSILVVSTVATTFEIAFLYWDALRSVHDLAREAGVRLFPPDVSERLGT